jgi:hypothetical protein
VESSEVGGCRGIGISAATASPDVCRPLDGFGDGLRVTLISKRKECFPIFRRYFCQFRAHQKQSLPSPLNLDIGVNPRAIAFDSARAFSGAGAEQIRANHQSQDCEDAGPDGAGLATRSLGGGNRIDRTTFYARCCTCSRQSWHEAGVFGDAAFRVRFLRVRRHEPGAGARLLGGGVFTRITETQSGLSVEAPVGPEPIPALMEPCL